MPGTEVTTARHLHVCPACGSVLVQPVWWGEAGGTRWQVTRRCPDCQWRGSDHHPQELLDRYDAELDRGSDELLTSLRTLAAERMAEDVERLAAALANDLILPEDF